jgi:hypothetical protein
MQCTTSEYHAIFHEFFKKANNSLEIRTALENMIFDLKATMAHKNDDIPHIFDPTVYTLPGARISRPAKHSPLWRLKDSKNKLMKKQNVVPFPDDKKSNNTCWIHSVFWFLSNWPNFSTDLSQLCQNLPEDSPLQLISIILEEWPNIRDLSIFNSIREVIFGSNMDTQEDAHEFLTKIIEEAQQYEPEIFHINFSVLERPSNKSHRENMLILGSDRITELDIKDELQNQAISGIEGIDGIHHTIIYHNLNQHVLIKTSTYFNHILHYHEFAFCDPLRLETSNYRLLSAITFESYDDLMSGHYMAILLQNGKFFLCNNLQKIQIDLVSAFDFIENFRCVFLFTRK